MSRLWVLALVLSLLVCEVLTCWLDQNGHSFSAFEPAYRIFHLLQMAFLIALAFMHYSSLEHNSLWRSVSRLVLAGLSFSFAGDVINSFLIDLSFIIKPQTLLSAIPFAIAHFLYIAAFWKIGISGQNPISRNLIILSLLIWPLLAYGLWQLLVEVDAGPVLKWLSFGYAHMVVLMALASLWPLRSMGSVAWVAAVGGLSFLVSDAFFGAWLVEGAGRPLWVSQTIWVTYFLAQLSIMQVPFIGRRMPGP